MILIIMIYTKYELTEKSEKNWLGLGSQYWQVWNWTAPFKSKDS